MLIGGVDIPDELLTAQENGDLVVFVGAGVSKPPPSNLPDFETLTKQVAQACDRKFDPSPDLDVFLNELQKQGYNVHEIVESILSRQSCPNRYHTYILKLFSSPETIRIITTNYDHHLITAAKVNGFPRIKITNGRAGYGDSFSGIVHLHGIIGERVPKIVLTSADIIRAYGSPGGCFQFLEKAFGKYVVLFIGYRLGDPVINRLPFIKGAKLYALTTRDHANFWRQHNTTPIVFPPASGSDRYEGLLDLLEVWAGQVETQRIGEQLKHEALYWENRVREVVSTTKPTIEDEDTINQAFREASKIRYFVRHAKDVFWLKWTNKKGLLDLLFNLDQKSNESVDLLSRWVVDFITDYEEDVLALIERHHMTLHPLLAHRIAGHLAYSDTGIQKESYERWIPLLLSTQTSGEPFGLMVNAFVYTGKPPDLGRGAIALFEYFTRPNLGLNKHFSMFDEEDNDQQVDYEVSLMESPEFFNRELSTFWSKYIHPLLPDHIDQLESLVTSRLFQAHALLGIVSGVDENWDRHSMSRSAIEPHPQDEYGTDLDPLIDAGRDILEFLVEKDKEKAEYLIERWISSDVPLLRRLAIHGMGLL